MRSHGVSVAVRLATLLLFAVHAAQARASKLGPWRGLQQEYDQSFPYMECNTSASFNPWRARLAYQEDLDGDTLVTIQVTAVYAPEESAISLNKIMVNLVNKSTLEDYRDRFVDARIWVNGTNYSYDGIVWNENRTIVRFTDLKFKYDIGYSGGGYAIMFVFKGGSFYDLCQPMECTYATITKTACALGGLGYAPIIVSDGPGFIQNLPSPSPSQLLEAPPP